VQNETVRLKKLFKITLVLELDIVSSQLDHIRSSISHGSRDAADTNEIIDNIKLLEKRLALLKAQLVEKG